MIRESGLLFWVTLYSDRDAWPTNGFSGLSNVRNNGRSDAAISAAECPSEEACYIYLLGFCSNKLRFVTSKLPSRQSTSFAVL